MIIVETKDTEHHIESRWGFKVAMYPDNTVVTYTDDEGVDHYIQNVKNIHSDSDMRPALSGPLTSGMEVAFLNYLKRKNQKRT